jgi:hypothetical protein
MQSKLFFGAALCLLLSSSACKRSVPEDIVDRSINRALMNAPATASAMCGVPVRGFSSVKSKIVKRGENNTGTAHLVGTPWLGKGTPASCEGDVEYSYSYTSKSSRRGRRTQTNVTWSLESLKLVAVTTPGVAFKPVTESPVDPDDDDKAPKTAPPT